MNKKLNKKLLNLIALCSGITATVAVGIGGVIYSLRQEKNGGDEPVDQKVLPEEVYEYTDDTKTKLVGFTNQFLANPDAYSEYDTIQIPASVTTINHWAFFNKSSRVTLIPPVIARLTFAEGSQCTMIGNTAFGYCSSLTSIDLSNCNNLVNIYPAAFSHCTAITSINLLNCVKLGLISSSCFSGCSSLTSASFPSSLSTIGSTAFLNCSNFNSIIWNKWRGGTSIGSGAFSGISSTGVVKVTNPIDAEHDSAALLASLKTFTSGFPSTGWDSI